MPPIHSTVEKTGDPSSWVLTLDEARAHCLALDDEDGYLLDLVKAAHEQIELATRRTLTATTLRAALDRFPTGDGLLELPRPPLVSVTTIAYTDTDGADQEVDVNDVTAVTSATPGVLLPSTSWPATKCGTKVVVTYQAGYTTPPHRAKHAARLLVGQWYRLREAVVQGQAPQSVPHGFAALVAGLKWGGYS